MASFRPHRGKIQAIIRRKGRRPITKAFPTKSAAQVWAREIETAIDRDELPVAVQRRGDKRTFGDICIRYRDDVSPGNKGHETEVWRINAFLRRPLAERQLLQLDSSAIVEYRNERLKKVSSGTVRTELELLQRILSRAIREWKAPLATNPVAEVQKPPKARSRDRRMLRDEQERLQTAITTGMRRCRNPYIEPLFVLAVETSCRRSELLKLRWDKVRLERRTAYLPDTKNDEDREIGLSSAAVAVLETLKARRDPRELRVFPITKEALKCAWRRLRKRAGSEDLRFHDLRHEAISRFFEEKSLTVPEAALMSGHKDYRMLARYTHMRAREVAGKLG